MKRYIEPILVAIKSFSESTFLKELQHPSLSHDLCLTGWRSAIEPRSQEYRLGPACLFLYFNLNSWFRDTTHMDQFTFLFYYILFLLPPNPWGTAGGAPEVVSEKLLRKDKCLNMYPHALICVYFTVVSGVWLVFPESRCSFNPISTRPSRKLLAVIPLGFLFFFF